MVAQQHTGESRVCVHGTHIRTHSDSGSLVRGWQHEVGHALLGARGVLHMLVSPGGHGSVDY